MAEFKVPKLGGIGHIPYERDSYWKRCSEYLGFEVPTKREIYDIAGYIPLPTIEKVHRSRATHRILAGGNRSGKSQCGTWEVIPYLFWDTKGWIVSANYEMAEVIRGKLEDILQDDLGHRKVGRPDGLGVNEYCFSNRNHTLTMWTGAEVQLKSAENPDSMHAVALDYILVDEASLFPYALYDTRLVPRLIDAGGWLLCMGTFEFLQGEWFEEYYEIGQTENEWGIESWCHPTEDNYHVYYAQGGESLAQVAARYKTNPHRLADMNPGVSWPLSPGVQVIIYNVDLEWLAAERARIPKEVYDARYKAEPAPNKYLVFPGWSPTENINAERAEFDPQLPVYLAVDPGGTYAVAAVQLKRFLEEPYTNELAKGWHVCVIDEIYVQTTITTQEVYNIARQRPWWRNVDRVIDWWDADQGQIDVMAKEQQRAWSQVVRAETDERYKLKSLRLKGKRVDINDGIKTLQHYLDTNTLWVHPRCTFFNLEMRRFHYPPATLAKIDTEDPRKANKPVDEWDHLVKALWYFLVRKFGCYGRSPGKRWTREDFKRMRQEEREALQTQI